jgi:hypothetical protein
MKKMIFLWLTLVVMGTAAVKAQVRIGDANPPTPGAVLDLNATGYKGGLLLPRVAISNLNSIAEFSSASDAATKLEGLIVYNTTPGAEGLYVWTGSKWELVWKKN